MRVQTEHKQYAAEKLTEGNMTKREIIEKLQSGVVRQMLTQSQANSCVRNQAKKLGKYNALTKQQKEDAFEQTLNNVKHKAVLGKIMDQVSSLTSKVFKKKGRKKGGDGFEGGFQKFDKNPKGKKAHAHN
jgi:hypothetical protein